MDNEKYVADQKAQLEAERVKRKETKDAADKSKVEALKARIAELEGSVSDRSEVQVLEARLAELQKIAPDPDAEIKAQLAENVRDAIAEERNFQSRPKALTPEEEAAKKQEDEAALNNRNARVQTERQAARDRTAIGAAPDERMTVRRQADQNQANQPR